MTGPRVDTPAAPRIPTYEEWSQMQSLTGPAVKAAIAAPTPSKGTTGLTRIPTYDEWSQMQSMTGPAIKAMQLPAMPPIAPRDATATAMDKRTKGKPLAEFNIKDPTTYANPVLRQIVNPAMDNPITTIGTTAALAVPGLGTAVGLAMAGSMVHHIASYGWQKAAEMDLSPEDRKRAEADPERISGESAAVQAAMLGLAPLIHVGVKSYKNFDVSMMDATGLHADGGQSGITRSGQFDLPRGVEIPVRRPGVLDARKNASFASGLEMRAADAALAPGERPSFPAPDGLVAPEGATLKRQPKPVEGLEVPEGAKVGKVAPLTTEEAISAARSADAERVLRRQESGVRRRPAGEKAPFFETEQGAQTLGATAARHGMPEDANPYHPDQPEAAAWADGHASATESVQIPSMHENAPIDETTGLPLNPDGTVTLYHHTSADAARAIESTGTLKSAGEPDVYLTTRKETDTGYGDTAVPIRVKPSKLQIDDEFPDGRKDFRMPVGKSGVKVAVERAPDPTPANATPAYPEGFSMGGALTDNRIPGAGEIPKAAKGIDGLQQSLPVEAPKTEDQALADALKPRRAAEPSNASETPAPVTASVAAGTGSAQGLATVEGTGETRTRGLSAGVERKAIENGLVTSIGDLPEYKRIQWDVQADAAQALLASDPALARRIALGEVSPPADLLPEAVFIAVENKATADGDVATIAALGRGQLAEQATSMGQRIGILRTRDPESPVGAIKRLIDLREGGKGVPKATLETIADIRAKLKGVSVSKEAWAEFVNSLRC